MNISVPDSARMIVEQLEMAGYAAYLVGGCVRDSLLGREPGDWDIATSALPEEVVACFEDYPVLETGLQHGTVTVLVDHCPYEVTTFRVDGEYSDNRRPDSVRFVRNLREDLARRDFTINALAWNPRSGLIDYFGGQADLAKGRIVCVGAAAKRFGEDALRILRAVRFASMLNFSIESGTAAAMETLAPSLANIAPERIRVEIDKALCGPGLRRAFAEVPAVLCAVFPELVPRIQSNEWTVVLKMMSSAPRDVAVRLALLLGGAGQAAADAARKILLRLRYDNETRLRVERLLRWCGERAESHTASVRRWLNRLGEEDFRRMLALWRVQGGEEAHIAVTETTLNTVLREKQCYRLRDLAVSGEDLMRVGVPEGPQIGKLLHLLLDKVIDGDVPNERKALLQEAEVHPVD